MMSVENAENMSSALWQNSKSFNELLRTADVSTYYTVEKLLTHIKKQL